MLSSKRFVICSPFAFFLLQFTALCADDPAAATYSTSVRRQPSHVHEFVISLPGGIKLSHRGAMNVPKSGFVLTEPFEFPLPSKFTLPAGTRVLQDPDLGWKGLRFRLPDGAEIQPSKSELVGLEVREPIEHAIKSLFPAPSSAVEQCRDKLGNVAASSGRAPTLAEFRKLLMDPPSPCTAHDYRTLWAFFIGQQRPEISLKNIRELHSSLRESIVSFRASWNVVNQWPDETDERLIDYQAGQFYFVMDSGKMRYDTVHGPNLDDLHITQSRSYDGEIERVYHADRPGAGAITHPLIASSYYFDSHHPLWLAKLIDSERDLGTTRPGLENFQARSAYPLECLVEFHGRMCVALLELGTTYYLDPAMNYAYCGMEAGRYVFDASVGRVVRSDDYVVHALGEFKHCGNGLWLPTHAVRTKYIGGVARDVTKVTVTHMVVNEEVDPSEFEQVIPAGVEVFDGIREMAYIQGGSKSVAVNLERVIERRSSRWVYGVIVAVHLLAISALVWRWRRVAK